MVVALAVARATCQIYVNMCLPGHLVERHIFSHTKNEVCNWESVQNTKSHIKPCIHCTQVPETSFDLLFLEQTTAIDFVLEFQKLLQCMQALKPACTSNRLGETSFSLVTDF